MNNLANAYAAVGRTNDELTLREETLRLIKAKLGPDHPHTLVAMSNLAMLLANFADAKLRDPVRALALATEAVQKSPQTADYRGTLGATRYRTGDWKGAIADLEQAIRLRKPDDTDNVANAFFLAMAHWQLADKVKAREWFDKAVQWMEKGKLNDAVIKRFRAEAAELLGVPEPTPMPEPPADKVKDKK
jgi:tetratricopeptide (TPR) repeat protein